MTEWPRQYKVFIASRFSEFKALRRQLPKTAASYPDNPIEFVDLNDQETYTQGYTIEKRSREQISGSDLAVFLLGATYKEADDLASMTETEWDTANKRPMPWLAYSIPEQDITDERAKGFLTRVKNEGNQDEQNFVPALDLTPGKLTENADRIVRNVRDVLRGLNANSASPEMESPVRPLVGPATSAGTPAGAIDLGNPPLELGTDGGSVVGRSGSAVDPFWTVGRPVEDARITSDGSAAVALTSDRLEVADLETDGTPHPWPTSAALPASGPWSILATWRSGAAVKVALVGRTTWLLQFDRSGHERSRELYPAPVRSAAAVDDEVVAITEEGSVFDGLHRLPMVVAQKGPLRSVDIAVSGRTGRPSGVVVVAGEVPQLIAWREAADGSPTVRTRELGSDVDRALWAPSTRGDDPRHILLSGGSGRSWARWDRLEQTPTTGSTS
jgi:hypothetical protein